MGALPHDAQGNPIARSASSEVSDDRPLAPAPLPVLAGVVALSLVLLYAASELPNDWIAVFAALAVLGGGAVVLDRTGRKRAAAEPSPMYRSDRLPSGNSTLKAVLVFASLIALVAWVTVTATPEAGWGSPLPFFLVAGFLYLVMPQLLARQAVRGRPARR